MPENFAPIGWQLQLLVATPIVAAVIVATAILAIHARRLRSEGWYIAAGLTGFMALTGTVLWVVAAIPFNPLYWQDYRVTGTVLSVSNTWTEDGGDMARTPVATLDTVDRPLVIDDPRAVTLQGEQVTLTCAIDWNFRAADTYVCRIAQIGA